MDRKNLFDALPGGEHGVQATGAQASAGQGNVDGFGGQSRVEQRVGHGLTARLQRAFDLLLGRIDPRTFGLACFGIELAEALEQLGQLAGLAKKASFLVFQRGGVGSGGERTLRFADDKFQIHMLQTQVRRSNGRMFKQKSVRKSRRQAKNKRGLR